MKKQLLFLMMMLLPLMANAQYVEVDGIYYNLISKGKIAEVTSPQQGAYSGAITIPTSITYEDESYEVKAIGIDAFLGGAITSITIPNTVTTIAERAFYGSNLTSITIPNSVKSIGKYAFQNCSFLSSVILPDSLTVIDDQTFLRCSFKTITIPNTVKSINFGAFREGKLESITIPKSVDEIGNCVFMDCDNLYSVTIPSSVKKIGNLAFNNRGLSNVYIQVDDYSNFCNNIVVGSLPSDNSRIKHLIDNEGNEIKNFVIPEGVASIGNRAFYYCKELNSITIPKTVTAIGDYTFAYCSGLESISIPASVKTIGERAFFYCYNVKEVDIENVAAWCTFKFEDEYDNPLYYAHHLLTNGEEIINLNIPNTVTSISDYAFEGCSYIKNITIGENVDKIGAKSFSGCVELKDFYCLVKNAPTTMNNAFEGSYIEYATLHVPAGSIDSYKSSSPWKDFGSIVELPKSKYKLSYIVDGEEYKSYNVEEGATITPEAAPTKEGYTFSGWSEIPATMPAHDVTITGTFAINKYKLTYKVDGKEYKSYDVEFGATITPEAAPTKEGYTFSGWSEIPATMPAHDVTITGTFSVNKYKLTYMVDGVEYKSYDVEYGATITPEAAPTKEGHTFSGWSSIPETMPAHDVTVTGTFSVNKYKLTYKVDGEEYKSYDIEYGATITPEAAPTKEGYTFSGWSEIPATMPAHDVTVTGTFTQIDYVVGETTYEVQNDEVSVKDGSKQSGNVEIQTTVVINDQTYKVTSIADNAFKGNTAITSVTIPNSITQIGTNAFEGCISLSEINIGNAVSSIGSKAFANITSASNAPRRASGTGLKVSCYAESVPSTASNAFENTSISNGTLLVEDNSVIAYKNSAPWSGFGTIMGFKEATGIEAIIVDIETGAKIYSLDGKPQNALQKGINIVRTSNGKTKKIIVK